MLQLSIATLLAVLAATNPASAWFRVPCTLPLINERVDPIVSAGSIPSQHTHTIHGGFNFAPNSTFTTLRASKCTNCQVAQDLSNYWFPKLYFKDPSTGKFEDVPNGGLLIYYQNRGSADKINGGPGLKAFPAGLKMVSGNAVSRSKKYPAGLGTQAELRERAVFFDCLRYTVPGAASYEGYGFPTTDCEAGLNARIHMPACWDGINLDSADHFSHVAYLDGMDNGNCPSTHPVPFMKLFYEITWDVTHFKSRWNPATQSWPFVYATGDPTGYSWHGDFQNGWDITVLQNAIDNCNTTPDQLNGITTACPYFTVTDAAIANTCKITTPHVNEAVTGVLDKLPGCNPVQPGPGDATLYTAANCPK